MSDLHANQGNAHDHQFVVPSPQPQEVHVSQTLDNDGQYREEHSWPTIRRYALGQIGPGDKAIKAVCPVCKSQISVAGLPRPDGEGKEGLVTPCGHIICSDCWPEKNSRALPENEVSFQRPNCPLCNQSLDCVGCGRSCTKQEVPEYSLCIEYIEAVPPTYPETELTYMPFCIGRCGAVPGSFGRWFPLHGQE